MASPNTVQYSLIKEVTAGTTPATPVFLRFANVPGENLQAKSSTITSPVLMPGGASAGITRVGEYVEGSLKTHFQRDGAGDVLIESALGGAFASNVAKCGLTPIPFTVEKTFVEGGSTFWRHFKGCQVTKMNLSCDATGIAEVSYDITGMSDARPATAITGSTYTATSNTQRLNGVALSNVTITGVTGVFAKVELSIESDREAQFALGTSASIGVGTSGARKVNCTITMYRSSYAVETALLINTPVAVSFTIGATTNGYTFTLPAAKVETPQDEEDGSKMFVKLSFVGEYDATALTDLSVTRLT